MNRARFIGMIPMTALALLWAAPAAAQNLKPHPAYTCSGQTDKVLNSVEINVPGIAVEVHGNCTLTIKNSRIHGGKKAIRVHGNGTLNIRNTVVVASKVAVHTHGNGTTNAKNSTFRGKIRVSGNGDFNKRGGNKFRKPGKPGKRVKAPPPPPPPAEDDTPAPPRKKYKKHGVVKCVGAGKRVLKGRKIITAGNAIKVVGSCRITLIGCYIEAGKAAVAVMGSGTIIIKDSIIKGGQAAIKIVGSGKVVAKDSRIKGGVKVVGTGRFVDKGGNTLK